MELFTLTKNDVAGLLQVSTRTVDRYVESKKFSTERVKGRIYFNRKEIESFAKQLNIDSFDSNLDSFAKDWRNVESPKNGVIYDMEDGESVAKPMAKVSNLSIPNRRQNTEVGFNAETEMFKKMYETMKGLFQSQQEELQKAHYRLGLLEKQKSYLLERLNSSVPLLELKMQEKDNNAKLSEIESLEKQKQCLEKEIELVKVGKIVYIMIAALSIIASSVLFAIY